MLQSFYYVSMKMILSCFLVSLLTILVDGDTVLPSSDLNLPAFCRPLNREGGGQYHPMTYPGPHIPWVWEAAHDQVTKNVDVTIMMPSQCHFNQTKWQEINKQFPQYTKHFSYGNISNMLVDAPDFSETYVPRLMGKQVQCNLYFHGKPVGSVKSLKFESRPPYMGPMMIRCPVQSIDTEFDAMQIEMPNVPLEKVTTNRTEVFPVCILPLYRPEKKQYNLSIVTATKRNDPAKLIEWIEYHMLVGVEHFFLYNTATGESQSKLSAILAPYVRRGLVSEILYPYMNCFTEGMAKGRKAKYMNVKGEDDHFQPPYPIVAYIAHASAYSRFRHTSKYILSTDDDEFISLTNQLALKDYNIATVADRLFSRYPQSPSIGFYPIAMNKCPVKDEEVARRSRSLNDAALVGAIPNRRRGGGGVGGEAGSSAIELPRLYTKAWGRIGRATEYKQLLRTDRVALFSVHYLSLLEASLNSKVTSDSEPFYIKIQHGAVLHFQSPAHESGDPFSLAEYLPIVELPQAKHCHSAVDMRRSLYPENAVVAGETDFYAEKVRNHMTPPELFEKLKVNYQKALKEQTETRR